MPFARLASAVLALFAGCASTPRTALEPLHAEPLGVESGPLPVVVPGAAWIDADLGPLAERLPLVVYDLRGRGRSPRLAEEARWTLESDVRDLESLRRRLGLERVSLFGWSYSGAVALRYALQHPERVERLVLVSPFPIRRADLDEYIDSFAARVDRVALAELEARRAAGGDLEEYARGVVALSLATYLADPAHAARMRSEPVRRPNLDPDRTARLSARILEALGDWDWSGELGELDVPVLVVRGGEDLVSAAAAERYVDALPKAEALELAGAGHMPWLDAPEPFFSGVQRFLEGGRSVSP